MTEHAPSYLVTSCSKRARGCHRQHIIFFNVDRFLAYRTWQTYRQASQIGNSGRLISHWSPTLGLSSRRGLCAGSGTNELVGLDGAAAAGGFAARAGGGNGSARGACVIGSGGRRAAPHWTARARILWRVARASRRARCDRRAARRAWHVQCAEHRGAWRRGCARRGRCGGSARSALGVWG